jgi:hypothetical protein
MNLGVSLVSDEYLEPERNCEKLSILQEPSKGEAQCPHSR